MFASLVLAFSIALLAHSQQDPIQETLEKYRNSDSHQHLQYIPEDVIEHEFNVFDQDKDGFLTAEELGNYEKKMGSRFGFKSLDLNQDQRINFNEFLILQYKEMEKFVRGGDL